MSALESSPLEPSRIRSGLLAAAVGAAPVAVFAVDAEGTVVFAEGGALRLLTGSTAGVDGLGVLEAWGETPRLVAAIGEALAGQRFAGEIRAGGRRFDARIVPLLDANRKVRGAAGLAVEDAPVELEPSGRDAPRILEALVESLPMSVWVLDQRGDVVGENAPAREHGRSAVHTAREGSAGGPSLVGRVLLEGRECRGVARVRVFGDAPAELPIRGVPLANETGSTVGALLLAAPPALPPAPPSLPIDLSQWERAASGGWAAGLQEASPAA